MPENDTNKETRPEVSIPSEEMHPRTEAGLRNALGYFQSIVDTIREPLLVLDAELHVITANRTFYQGFQVSPAETEGRFLYDLGPILARRGSLQTAEGRNHQVRVAATPLAPGVAGG